MKVAVTGASGHIGSEVCRQLLRQGHEVVGLVHNDTKAIEGLPLTCVKGNVTDPECLKELLTGCEALIHTAAVIELTYGFCRAVHDVNVTGTQYVLDVASSCGLRRVVHFSSVHVFKQSPYDEVLNESRALVGNDSLYYDQSKRDGHLLAIKAARKGTEVIVLCPSGVVGPPDFKPSHLGKAVKDIYSGNVPAVIRGGFDFVDVRDVASAAVNALAKGRSGEAYILAGQYCTLKQFADWVLKEKPGSRPIGELPMWVAKAALPLVKLFSRITGKRPLYDKTYLDVLQDGNRFVSSEKAEKELGFKARDLELTLHDTVRWLKDKGKL